MVNSRAYQIVREFVKSNKNLYRTGQEFGVNCYSSNLELKNLIVESTACAYACSCMIELGMRKGKDGYTEKELIELLDNNEYLGRGLYQSIKRNNKAVGTDWDPLELIEINKNLLKDYVSIVSKIDIAKLYGI